MKYLISFIFLVTTIQKTVAQSGVDYVTGTAGISMPVAQIQGHSLSLPVVINYSSGGIRVNDVSSWVGTGWNLDAGGQISRTQIGTADEVVELHVDNPHISDNTVKYAGYLYCKDFYYNETTKQNEYPNTFDSHGAGGTIDLSPDEFYISAPGLQAKFIFTFDQHNESDFFEYDDSYRTRVSPVMIIPYQPLKIEYTLDPINNGTFTEFIVTNESGFKYYFNELNLLSTEVHMISSDESVDRTESFTTCVGWYLTRIENQFGQIEATYLYEENTNASSNLYYSEVRLKNEGMAHHEIERLSDFEFGSDIFGNDRQFDRLCEIPYGWMSQYVTTTQKIKHLSEIHGRDESIVFTKSNIERLDLTGDYFLESVSVLKNGVLSSRIEFSYDYFVADPDLIIPDFIPNQDKFRLRLQKIQQFNSDGELFDKGVSFDYSDDKVVHRNSFAQDFWGFYNGQDDNTRLAPFHSYGDVVVSQNKCDRTTGNSSMCQIERINNAMNGRTEFEFEPHDFHNLEGQDILPYAVKEEVTEFLSCEIVPGYYEDPLFVTSSAVIVITEPQWVFVEYSATQGENVFLMPGPTDPQGWMDFIVQYGTDIVSPDSRLFQVKIISSDSQVIRTPLFTAEEQDGYFLTTQTKEIYLPAGTYTFSVQIGGSENHFNMSAAQLSATLHFLSDTDITTDVRTVGGKRIKSITQDDGDEDHSNDIVRRFEYHKSDPVSGTTSSGYLLSEPRFVSSIYNGLITEMLLRHTSGVGIVNDDYRFTNTYDCSLLSYSSNTVNPIEIYGGSPVMYSNVEVFYEKLGNTTGKTRYEFWITEFGENSGVQGTVRTAKLWKNAALRAVTNYDASNNIVDRTEYEYDELADFACAPIRSRQTRITSMDGSYYTLIDGISEAVLNQIAFGALLNSGPTIISAVIIGVPNPLGWVALAVSIANVLRAGVLYAFNYNVITNVNDEGAITYYTNYYQTYRSDWFRLREAVKTEYSRDHVSYTTSVQSMEYPQVSVNEDWVLSTFNLSPRKTTQYNQFDPTNKRSQFVRLNSDIPLVDATGTSNMREALIEMNSLGITGLPIEVIQLREEGGVPYVVGGYLTLYSKIFDLEIPNSSVTSGVVPIENYKLAIDQPIPLSSYVFCSLNSAGGFDIHPNYRRDVTISAYDQFILPTATTPEHDITNSIIRGIHGEILANAINATPSQVKILGFEEAEFGDGDWQFNTNGINDDAQLHNGFELPIAKTGLRSCEVRSGISRLNIPAGNYRLSFWAQGHNLNVQTISGDASITNVLVASDQDVFNWKYYEYLVSCTQVSAIKITGASTQRVDEIRFIADGAMVTTSQYNTLGQRLSNCNVNGECSYISYDNFHQIRFVFDDERNVRAYTEMDRIFEEESIEDRVVIKSRVASIGNIEFEDFTDFSESSINNYLTRSSRLDGLGRPTQVVNWDATFSSTATPWDIIQVFEYDKFNRQPLRYLPYTHHNSGHGFRADALTELSQFYQSTEEIAHTSYPYSESEFATTPSRNVIEQGSPGEEFQLATGHTMKAELTFCRANEVMFWFHDPVANDVNSTSFWPENSLQRFIQKDENGKMILIYKDIFDRIILIRRPAYTSGLNGSFHFTDENTDQITNLTNLNDPDLYFIDNYFVYDEFDRIIVEITPLMLEAFQHRMELGVSNPNKFSYLNDATASQFGLFRGYGKGRLYDKRQRLIASKSPDSDWTHFIYNERNELVMSQDAVQKVSNKWSFIRYDDYGRVLFTGLTTSNLSPEEMQEIWDEQYEGLSESITGNYSQYFGYSNSAPFSNLDEILTVNYYDTYPSNITDGAYVGDNIPSLRTKGFVTVSFEKLLGPYSGYAQSVSHFDLNGKAIQVYQSGILSGYDRYNYSYDFLGRVKNITRHHFNLETSDVLEIYNELDYDNAGRLRTLKQRTGENEPLVTLSRIEYNQLGQVVRKHLHRQPGAVRAMQIMDYRYNIRGWLTKINNSNLVDDGDNNQSDDVFGEELFYTASDYFHNGYDSFEGECEHHAERYYNGLPGAMKWSTKNPDDAEDGTTIPEHSYVYKYDDLYRMTAGYYAKEDLTVDFDMLDCEGNYGLFEHEMNYFTEKVSYDVGGNILGLDRYRPIQDAAFVVDELDYEYYRNSNMIQEVSDLAISLPLDNSMSQYYDQIDEVNDFTYDQIGNILGDKDRNLSYEYNALGLTSKVLNTATNENVVYGYSASGSKYCEVYGTTKVLYLHGIQYIDDGSGFRLKQIKTATGAVRPTTPGSSNTTLFVYDYFIEDHLGNVRVVLTEENAEVITDVATIEPGNIQDELEVFDGIVGSDVSTPYDWPNVSVFNSKVSELSALGSVVGPSYLKPVTYGEMVQVDVQSYYRSDQETNTTGQTLVQIFAAMLINIGVMGQDILPPGESGIGMFNDATSSPSLGLFNFLNNGTSDLNESNPKSYLVYIFMDSNLKIRPEYSGVVQVGAPDDLKTLQMLERKMPADGYFYTFVTNQSTKKVYYNDLKVTRQKGQILAVNNYYPFGLMWTNPSSETNSTYQGKEFQMGEWQNGDLSLYDFGARLYNPVLARWQCTDPMDQFDSPYNAMGNNPVINIDPDGMFSIPWGAILSNVGTALSSVKQSFTSISLPFMTKTTHTYAPFAKAGSALNMAGTILSMGMDAKAISDAAGEIGSGLKPMMPIEPVNSHPALTQHEFDLRYSFDFENRVDRAIETEVFESIINNNDEDFTQTEYSDAVEKIVRTDEFSLREIDSNSGVQNSQFLYRVVEYEVYSFDEDYFIYDQTGEVPGSRQTVVLDNVNYRSDDPVFVKPNSIFNESTRSRWLEINTYDHLNGGHRSGYRILLKYQLVTNL